MLAKNSISFESRFSNSNRSPNLQNENLKKVGNCQFGTSVCVFSSPIEFVTAVKQLMHALLQSRRMKMKVESNLHNETSYETGFSDLLRRKVCLFVTEVTQLCFDGLQS